MCAPRVELASERHALGTQLRSEIADGEIRGEIRDTHQNPHPKSGRRNPGHPPKSRELRRRNPGPTKIPRTPEAKSGTPTKIPRTPGPCVELEIHPRCC